MSGEFHFWAGARHFVAAREKLTGAEIKAIADINSGYPLYRDIGAHFSDHQPIGDGVLVDVDGAHFYALIPATAIW